MRRAHPGELEARYFSGGGQWLLSREDTFYDVAFATYTCVDFDLGGVAMALQETHTLWISSEAPARSVGVAYRSHHKLLSLMLADYTRKIESGLDEREWFVSIGLSSVLKFDDGVTLPQLKQSVKEKLQLTRAQERAWLEAWGRREA